MRIQAYIYWTVYPHDEHHTLQCVLLLTSENINTALKAHLTWPTTFLQIYLMPKPCEALLWVTRFMWYLETISSLMELERFIGYLLEVCWTTSHNIDNGGIFISAADLGFLYRSDSCCIIASPVEEMINTTAHNIVRSGLNCLRLPFLRIQNWTILIRPHHYTASFVVAIFKIFRRKTVRECIVYICLYIWSSRAHHFDGTYSFSFYSFSPLFSQFLSFSPCSRYSSLPCL